MTERKPPQAPQPQFFIPGTSDKEIERLQKQAEQTEAQVSAEAARSVPPAAAEDDPDALLKSFVESQKPLIDSKVDVDVAGEALRTRHNTHLTQLRIIEMEKRRQRRAKKEGRK
jgi:hypothetical protein